MLQRSLSVESLQALEVTKLLGDLRVAGWERAEILAKTDGDTLEFEQEGNKVLLKCDEDLILYLPSTTCLHIGSISGDASLQALQGKVELDNVAGNLSLHDIGSAVIGSTAQDASFRQVGAVAVKKILGDLSLRSGKADCSIQSVGGDVSLRDVEGNVKIDDIGSNLFLRNVRGSVTVTVLASATLSIKPQPGQEYHISAGEALLLRLPSDADVELHLEAGSPDSIQVDFSGITFEAKSNQEKLTLGSGAAKMFLSAKEELIVTSHAGRRDSFIDFGVETGESEWLHVPPIPSLPEDLNERISNHIQRAMQKAQSRAERASRKVERARAHAEAASRRAELKVEAAMRRAETKLHAARKHARGAVVIGGSRVFEFGGTPQDVAPVEPVSEEERLAVLRLLQEKKIGLEEAESLLAALEGRSVAESDEQTEETSAADSEAQETTAEQETAAAVEETTAVASEAQETAAEQKAEAAVEETKLETTLGEKPRQEKPEPARGKSRKSKKGKKEAKK